MQNNVNGMSLIELLVVMSIVAVVLSLGLPGFNRIRERTQATNVYYSLTSSLMTARSGAITRRRPVTVCPSAEGLTCRDDGVWDEGWIVFLDSAKTGQPANTAAVIRRVDRVGNDLTVRASVGRPKVRYQPDGRSSGTNVSFKICSRRNSSLLGGVIVNNSGRARSERTTNASTPCPFAL